MRSAGCVERIPFWGLSSIGQKLRRFSWQPYCNYR